MHWNYNYIVNIPIWNNFAERKNIDYEKSC